MRCKFSPWVGKILWRRAWQPPPVLPAGESQRQRSLGGATAPGVTAWTRLMGLSMRATLRRKRTLSHGAGPWQPGLGWVTLDTWSRPMCLTHGQWSQSHKARGICGQAGAGPPSKACPQGRLPPIIWAPGSYIPRFCPFLPERHLSSRWLVVCGPVLMALVNKAP